MKQFSETIKLLDQSGFYYIITANMQGNYSYINSHYAKAFEHISDSFVGKPYDITMHPDDRKICEEVSIKCFQNPGKLFPATIRKHDGKGGYIITQWEYRAMFDEDNNPEGIFCLGYDITQFIIKNQELEGAKSEINQKKQLLRQIAYDQSHLIRMPLSNIMGLASILDNMEMDQNLRNICNMIIESSAQLDVVIRDVVNKTYA